MHDDHAHDAGHGDDHGAAHGGAAGPLEISWNGLGLLALAIAAAIAVSWWASNNKPAAAAPVGRAATVRALVG